MRKGDISNLTAKKIQVVISKSPPELSCYRWPFVERSRNEHARWSLISTPLNDRQSRPGRSLSGAETNMPGQSTALEFLTRIWGILKDGKGFLILDV